MTACGGGSSTEEPGAGGLGGNAGTGGGTAAGGAGASIEVSATAIGELDDGAYLLALDANRLAVIDTVVEGDALCPDCVDIPLDQCPASCERHHLDVHVRDHDGAVLGPAARLVTWFPPAFDHYAGEPARVALGGATFGLVWRECDGRACSPGISSQRCTGRYQRFDGDGQALGEPVTLYEGWWGDVELAYNTAEEQILVLHSPIQGGALTSARITVIDPAGATLLPWTAIGSSMRFAVAATAHGAGFMVALTDGHPGGATTDPCQVSCDCFTLSPPLTPDTAVLAVPVDEYGLGAVETIAAETVIAVPQLVSRGDRLVLIGVRSDEAVAFERMAGAWTERGSLEAPSMLWFDGRLLGDGTALWLGSDQTDPEDANVQQLVAGAIAAGGRSRVGLAEPQRIFMFGSTRTGIDRADGSVRVFGVQGRWPDGSSSEWAGFDIVRIDAASAD